MIVIINKERMEINSLKELEPLKQLVASNKPLVTKAKKTKPFIFIYQIEGNRCKFSSPNDKVITLPEGYQKYVINATSPGSSISLFKKQARRESGINQLQFHQNIS